MNEPLSLEFVDELPPVEKYLDREVEDILIQLKANPGKWALICRDASEHLPNRFPGTEHHRQYVGKRHRYDIYLRWPVEGQPMRELTWEDPPEFIPNQTARRRMVDETVDQLMARPGQWAIVEKWEGNANTSRRKKWQDRGLEVVVRTRGGFGHIYARWPKDA